MKVIEINEGSKIPYEVSKTKICFDDDLTINLAKRQEDWPVHIDILTDNPYYILLDKRLVHVRSMQSFPSSLHSNNQAVVFLAYACIFQCFTQERGICIDTQLTQYHLTFFHGVRSYR